MKTIKSFFINKHTFEQLILCFCFVLSMISCNSQAQKNEQLFSYSNKVLNQLSDTTNKPKISYKVNKQVDKNGNLIKYDSTYTYVYSGTEGKAFSALNTDSILNNFSTEPFKLFNKKNKSSFNDDMFFDEHFFDNTFFEKQIQLNNSLFDRFFNQKDTIHQNYTKNRYSKKI